MNDLLKEVVDPETLKKSEAAYKKEKVLGTLSNETEFEYAMCLIRSRYKQDWEVGLKLLMDLYRSKTELKTELKRDYIYFIAFTHCKLENYDEAIRCCKAFLTVEPLNRQMKNMLKFAEEAKKKKQLAGAAVVGGGALVLGLGLAAGAALLAKAARK